MDPLVIHMFPPSPGRVYAHDYGKGTIRNPPVYVAGGDEERVQTYAAIKSKKFREASFSISNKEEGNPELDRPLIIQVAFALPPFSKKGGFLTHATIVLR